MTRIGVTGGRNYLNHRMATLVLATMAPDAILVHGGASGADSICASAWERMGRVTEAHPANWQSYGRSAGPIRNQEMVKSGLDVLIAFPGGRGTAHMTHIAAEAGVPVLTVRD